MVSSFAAAVFGSSEVAETLAVIPELVVKVPTNFTESVSYTHMTLPTKRIV